MRSSILGCISETCKTSVNQDYCCKVTNETSGFKGVIVADGIGSHMSSELSSKFCSEKLMEILEQVTDERDIDFPSIFSTVKQELEKFYKTLDYPIKEVEGTGLQLGTTLICALEFDSFYKIAYLGNGAVWHVRGNFSHFSERIYVPWNSVNILNPHSIEQFGKPALTNYISLTDACISPTVLTISKDLDIYGEIIILATDGLYSADQVPVGKDENNVVWIKGEDSMTRLYKLLSGFLIGNSVTKDEESLLIGLKEYITELKDNFLMHDDTTIGIIISEKTLAYCNSLFPNENKS